MIRDDIKSALVSAMKSGDKAATATLRMVQSAIKNRDIELRTASTQPDDDALVTEVLQKMIKQRRESVELYRQGGREELAAAVGANWRILDDGTIWLGVEGWAKATLPADADVIEHLDDPGAAIDRCHELLAPDGVLHSRSAEERGAADAARALLPLIERLLRESLTWALVDGLAADGFRIDFPGSGMASSQVLPLVAEGRRVVPLGRIMRIPRAAAPSYKSASQLLRTSSL